MSLCESLRPSQGHSMMMVVLGLSLSVAWGTHKMRWVIFIYLWLYLGRGLSKHWSIDLSEIGKRSSNVSIRHGA